jgi:hypothetical protein
VGVLAAGPTLFISDQSANAVVTTPLAAPGPTTPFAANVAAPDLLCNGPGGSTFTGGKNGAVRQISSTGQVTTVAEGFLTIRGVAYDAKNRRLFAAEHDPGKVKNALRILPVN